MTVRGVMNTQSTRLEALRAKHAMLSEQIDDAHKTPSVTDYYLKQLKKQKLRLKEEMEELSNKQATA